MAASIYSHGAALDASTFQPQEELRNDLIKCLNAKPDVLLESAYKLRRWLIANSERSTGPLSVLDSMLPLSATASKGGLPWAKFAAPDEEIDCIPHLECYPEDLLWGDEEARAEFVQSPSPSSSTLAAIRDRVRIIRLHSPQFEGSARGVLVAVCAEYQQFMTDLIEGDKTFRENIVVKHQKSVPVAVEGIGYYRISSTTAANVSASLLFVADSRSLQVERPRSLPHRHE